MMEQGTVVGRKITFHLKQFLRRTFSVGSSGVELDIREVRSLFHEVSRQFRSVKQNSSNFDHSYTFDQIQKRVISRSAYVCIWILFWRGTPFIHVQVICTGGTITHKQIWIKEAKVTWKIRSLIQIKKKTNQISHLSMPHKKKGRSNVYW